MSLHPLRRRHPLLTEQERLCYLAGQRFYSAMQHQDFMTPPGWETEIAGSRKLWVASAQELVLASGFSLAELASFAARHI
jgi:hypothetical protein